MTALIERGIARGEIRPDVPVDIGRDLGHAILWHRFPIIGDPIISELIDHILIPDLPPAAGEPTAPPVKPTKHRRDRPRPR